MSVLTSSTPSSFFRAIRVAAAQEPQVQPLTSKVTVFVAARREEATMSMADRKMSFFTTGPPIARTAPQRDTGRRRRAQQLRQRSRERPFGLCDLPERRKPIPARTLRERAGDTPDRSRSPGTGPTLREKTVGKARASKAERRRQDR